MTKTPAKLDSLLWDAANTLRGSAVDRTDWKGYILPLLFFKRISDVWDEETVEAAIVDGANPLQVFFKIKVPQIMSTIVVVWTTITLVVLKVFDIVFAMTNGQWETQVLANYMFDKLFRASDWGVGSASAIIIMLLVSPILVWNVYQARKEMR